MFEIKGKYNVARVMLNSYNDIDESTFKQITEMVNSIAFEGYPISIMPDCHAGKGSTIGFTMPLGEFIMPNIVGVDIGCGMSSFKLPTKDEINFEALDKFIRLKVPLGTNIHQFPVKAETKKLQDELEILSAKVGCERTFYSIGSLGGGNHFIEIDRTEEGENILVVHSGSRNLGERTCRYHQAKAIEVTVFTKELNGYVGFRKGTKEGVDYLLDMRLCQEYARMNRFTILETILEGFFNCNANSSYFDDCIHNYVSADDFIVRKGAISARPGTKVVIPLNMRDGIIFGTGKANADWNFSAPHGAGRTKSRSQANKDLSLKEFQETMRGVYSTSVGQHTLDEAPSAYKDSSMIIEAVKEVVDIKYIAKPVYNLKA